MKHDDDEILFDEANLGHDLPDEEANLDYAMPDDKIRNHDVVVISEDEPDNCLADDTVTNFEEENNEKVQSDDDDSVMNEVDGNSIDYNNSGAANADDDAQDNTDAFAAYSEQDEENEERASVEQINDVINEENYYTRLRRTNAGTGAGRLHMSYDGKGYTHEKTIFKCR